MLFLNISSDKVQISYWSSTKYLDRNGIENTLGPTLIKIYRKLPFDSVFLLNWPGGFTNLRVGTLALNMISKLIDYEWKKSLKIYSISKPDLYKHLYKKWILPKDGFIYLWQKQNAWIYDSKTNKYEIIRLSDIKKSKELFLDFVKEKYWPLWSCKLIKFSSSDDWIIITYKHHKYPITIKDLKLKPQSQIKPNYFINAIN